MYWLFLTTCLAVKFNLLAGSEGRSEIPINVGTDTLCKVVKFKRLEEPSYFVKDAFASPEAQKLTVSNEASTIKATDPAKSTVKETPINPQAGNPIEAANVNVANSTIGTKKVQFTESVIMKGKKESSTLTPSSITKKAFSDSRKAEVQKLKK